MSLRLVSTAAANRAEALLGETPTLTLIADGSAPDSCCTARLVRRGPVWLGVVSDRAQFTDHVRMGLVPRFFLGDAAVVTVSGVARTRVLGRVGLVGVDIAAAIASLIGPWGGDDAVVIEVSPESVVVDDVEEFVGAVPRT